MSNSPKSSAEWEDIIHQTKAVMKDNADKIAEINRQFANEDMGIVPGKPKDRSANGKRVADLKKENERLQARIEVANEELPKSRQREAEEAEAARIAKLTGRCDNTQMLIGQLDELQVGVWNIADQLLDDMEEILKLTGTGPSGAFKYALHDRMAMVAQAFTHCLVDLNQGLGLEKRDLNSRGSSPSAYAPSTQSILDGRVDRLSPSQKEAERSKKAGKKEKPAKKPGMPRPIEVEVQGDGLPPVTEMLSVGAPRHAQSKEQSVVSKITERASNILFKSTAQTDNREDA